MTSHDELTKKETWETMGKAYKEGFFDHMCSLVLPDLFDKISQTQWYKSESDEAILDIGTGVGAIPRFIVENYQNRKNPTKIYAIDLSSTMIERVQKAILEEWGNAKYVQVIPQIMNAEDLQFKDESFPLIVSNIALLFPPNLNLLFSEIYRVLKKDGTLIFSTWREDCECVQHHLECLFKATGKPKSEILKRFGTLEKVKPILENAGFKNISCFDSVQSSKLTLQELSKKVEKTLKEEIREEYKKFFESIDHTPKGMALIFVCQK